MIRYMQTHYEVSESRACAVAMCSRALYRYESRRDPRTELRARIREIAHARIRYGYRRVHVLLGREGWQANHKLVYRLYREEGLGGAPEASQAPCIGGTSAITHDAGKAQRGLEHGFCGRSAR
jgi:putative transposase